MSFRVSMPAIATFSRLARYCASDWLARQFECSERQVADDEAGGVGWLGLVVLGR